MSKLVGLVGWRGMVGSVLMDRMQEKDFDLIEPLFFSTSNAGGGKAPAQARNETTLQDATTSTRSSAARSSSPPGAATTPTRCYPCRAPRAGTATGSTPHRPAHGKNAVIVLDPVNMPVIKNALARGGKDWIGGNCTVSCMLMGVGALYKAAWSSG